MISNHIRSAAAYVGAGMVLLFATGCTDDRYDLDNLDNTIQIGVNDLTVPLNLEPVKFSSVVDLTDEECIEEDANGNYALVQHGDFSEIIELDRIFANPVSVDDAQQSTIPYVYNTPVPLTEATFNFVYENDSDMNKYITHIESGKVDFMAELTITVTDKSTGMGVYSSLEDVQLRIPSGFHGTYDKPNGQQGVIDESNDVAEFTGYAEQVRVGMFRFDFDIDEIDIDELVANGNGYVDYESGLIHFEGAFDVVGGSLTLLENIYTDEVSLSYELALSQMELMAITGTVHYLLEDIGAQEIEFNNLPDVLRDEQTSISLVNPQIYLRMTNPLGDDNFRGIIDGLTIRQERYNGGDTYSATMVDPLRLAAVSEPQEYLICPEPEAVTSYYSGFQIADDADHKLTIPGLGDIVNGRGLPEKLIIDFQSPELEETRVVDFYLGQDFGSVYGEYTLYAPLEFAAGSRIVYEADQTGWGMDSEDDLTVTQLNIKADLHSEIPLDLELSAYPLDSNGNEIITDGRRVTVNVEPAVIPAMYEGPVTITMDGGFENIDGIHYYVRMVAGQNSDVLNSNLSLDLKNIRATVSGHYTVTDDGDDEESYEE